MIFRAAAVVPPIVLSVDPSAMSTPMPYTIAGEGWQGGLAGDVGADQVALNRVIRGIIQEDVALGPGAIISRDQVPRAGRGAADRDKADLSRDKTPASRFGSSCSPVASAPMMLPSMMTVSGTVSPA